MINTICLSPSSSKSDPLSDTRLAPRQSNSYDNKNTPHTKSSVSLLGGEVGSIDLVEPLLFNGGYDKTRPLLVDDGIDSLCVRGEEPGPAQGKPLDKQSTWDRKMIKWCTQASSIRCRARRSSEADSGVFSSCQQQQKRTFNEVDEDVESERRRPRSSNRPQGRNQHALLKNSFQPNSFKKEFKQCSIKA